MPRALLFDVGDVLLASNWDVLDAFERATGRRVPGRGPLDPDGDEDWQRYLAGDLTADAYWDAKARAAGYAERRELWGAFSVALGSGVFSAVAMAFVAEARAAGVPTGILSNDLVASAGRAWVDARPELAGYDVFVDCTELGVRKPDPAPYLRAIADFGLPPEEIVFLDDTPACIDGARAVGMVGVLVDPVRQELAFDRARALVGLRAPSLAERLAADVDGAVDAAALAVLLHPDAMLYVDGRRIAVGRAEAGRVLGGRRARREVRAATEDTVCLESRLGSEIWTLRHGLIIEWCAYGGEPMGA